MTQRFNQYNQPIGEEALNWQARPFPSEMYYEGLYTIVTRLAEEHTDDLYHAYKQSHPSNWTYLFDEPPEDYESFKQSILNKINDKAHIFYVVINKENNKALGIYSLMRIDQANGVIEVGNVNFSDALRRTRMSTEAHYLLAKYVFDELGYRRYEWKCDSLNAPSIKTAKRLGFTYEGTFRHAVIYKNRSRDTSWFAMLKEEWPLHKQTFEIWLAKENFNENGFQIKRLEEIREQLKNEKPSN